MVQEITEREKQNWHYTLTNNSIFTYEDMDLAKELFVAAPFSVVEKGIIRTGSQFILRAEPSLRNYINQEAGMSDIDDSRKLPRNSWRIIRYFNGKDVKDILELCAYAERYELKAPNTGGYGNFAMRVKYFDEKGVLRQADKTFTLDSSLKCLYHVAPGDPTLHHRSRRFDIQ